MPAGIEYTRIPEDRLLDDYYANIHGAYRAMNDAFEMRADAGLTQDDIATMLNVDKGLVSKRLNGTENLTMKTLSYMGTAMSCLVTVTFTPYESVCVSNFYRPTESINSSVIGVTAESGQSGKMGTMNAILEPADG
jgi:transcriptional regulator with XRE-family HTH domain